MDLELGREISKLELKIRKGDLNQIVLLPDLYKQLGWDITEIVARLFDLRQDGEKVYLIKKEDEIRAHYIMLTEWLDRLRSYCPEKDQLIYDKINNIEKVADHISENVIEGRIESLKQDRTDLVNSMIELKQYISELPKDSLKNKEKFYYYEGWVNKVIQGLARMIRFAGKKEITFSYSKPHEKHQR